MNPDRVRETLQAKRSRMIAAQTTATNDLSAIEDRVKGVLAEHDISTVTFVWYYDFAREVYRLVKTHGGGKPLVKEVGITLYKWKERGADEVILAEVRDEVFAVRPPA
jgi:hypothetical protein